MPFCQEVLRLPHELHIIRRSRDLHTARRDKCPFLVCSNREILGARRSPTSSKIVVWDHKVSGSRQAGWQAGTVASLVIRRTTAICSHFLGHSSQYAFCSPSYDASSLSPKPNTDGIPLPHGDRSWQTKYTWQLPGCSRTCVAYLEIVSYHNTARVQKAFPQEQLEI